jgi:hypothetical protein
MPTDEAERYRQAAENTLGQLDWCIRYLRRIHRERIAAQLAKNTAYIRRSLLRQAERPSRSQTPR